MDRSGIPGKGKGEDVAPERRGQCVVGGREGMEELPGFAPVMGLVWSLRKGRSLATGSFVGT